MIKIHDRFRPFSHRPGTSCLVPGTKLVVTAYPTLIEISSDGKKISSTTIEGTYDSFLIGQDLEQGFVIVISNQKKHFIDKEGKISSVKPAARSNQERLSLGMNKAQNWDAIRERADLREILPLWHKLSGYYQGDETFSDPLPVFMSYFSKSFVPRVSDFEHQGFNLPVVKDPYAFLSQKAIRSLFIEEENEKVVIKKSPFITGRLIHVPISYGSIHYEWTKNFPRRLFFDGDITKLEIAFPPDVRSYRVSTTEKGLLFDRFEA